MFIEHFIIAVLLSIVQIEIVEPVDGETYFWLDTLNVRAILDLGTEVPNSVEYRLNGGAPVPIDKLNTDWFTYMGGDNKSR
ncbi:MAG: hypothetical protein KAH31_07585 [Candidatus Sabulitectum sp.]|nr:hypothetical protein [Candidatus Sabulitectum sp.]